MTDPNELDPVVDPLIEVLIDTHQHLIFPERFRYSWTESVPALSSGRFDLHEYRRQAGAAGIGRTLFMETGVDDPFWQDETRHLLSLADEPGNRIAGVISGCRPENDASEFDAWLDELSETAVVGFRRILHTMPDELSTSARFVRNIRELGRRNQPFDMCFLERQLPFAVQLAHNCDNTHLVLDHCGVPDIAGGDFAAWQDGIRQLASLPNVSCKLSGLVAYCPAGAPLQATIQPYIEHCADVFGWDRLIWGSDWPVCNTTSGISEWVSVFRNLIASETADVRKSVFADNAVRIYGIGVRN